MKAVAYSVAYSASSEPIPVEVKMGPNSTAHALHGACRICHLIATSVLGNRAIFGSNGNKPSIVSLEIRDAAYSIVSI